MRATRGAAAVLATLLLGACGGSDGPPAATPTTAAPTTSKAPKPKPKKKPSATPSASATPTPTATPTPPPPTGEPVGTEGALVALSPESPTRKPGDCTALFPDLKFVTCTELKMAAGSMIWGTGRLDGAKAVRLLTPVEGGYRARYEGRDANRTWSMVKVSAYPLAGTGVDGAVVSVRTTGGGLTYDVLTWVQGGPLVLRAHRRELADGRLRPEEGGLAEYAALSNGSFIRRRLAWDGRHFLLSKATGVPADRVPAR